MKVTTIEKDKGGVRVTAESLEETKTQLISEGYKVVAELNIHAENGRLVPGGYQMAFDEGIFPLKSEARIIEHSI
jgi:hypothetical protein